MISLTENEGYLTKKFTDIYSNIDAFLSDYTNVGIPTTIAEKTATTLYYLLYARYGNSHIYNTDETQFKYKLFAIIFQYAPTWEKRLEIQNNLRNLTEDEILQGGKSINNHAYHNGEAPSTSSLEELSYINEQHSNNWKKSKLDAYSTLYEMLRTDVTEEFLKKFSKLFIPIASIQHIPYFITEEDE